MTKLIHLHPLSEGEDGWKRKRGGFWSWKVAKPPIVRRNCREAKRRLDKSFFEWMLIDSGPAGFYSWEVGGFCDWFFWMNLENEFRSYKGFQTIIVSGSLTAWKWSERTWDTFRSSLKEWKGAERLLQWRVWSWLRMNASGRPNTCKSNGKYSAMDMRVTYGCVTRMQPTLYRRIARGNSD